MNCIACNAELSLINREKIKNKEYICKKCLKKMPNLISSSISDFESEEIKQVKSYMENNHQKLLEIFEVTDFFGSLFIDQYHGYFALHNPCKVTHKKLPKKCRDIYEFSNLTDAGFLCKNVRNITISGVSLVAMDVEFYFSLSYPHISVRTVIGSGVPCDMVRNSKGTIDYTEPAKLTMFRNQINQILQNNYAKNRRYQENVTSDANQNTEIIKAMALFMLDENFTKEDLKRQRNRLMKTFHPDSGADNTNMDVYAQKINDAYKLLINCCTE